MKTMGKNKKKDKIEMTHTTHQDSNQQFHDLHTLDIGRHVADKGNSSLLKNGLLKDKLGLTFDPNRRYRKKKKKEKIKSEEEKNG
jgi:hypothetical protein